MLPLSYPLCRATLRWCGDQVYLTTAGDQTRAVSWYSAHLTSPDCCLHVLCYVMVSTIISSSPPAGWDQTRLQTQRSCAASGDTAPIRQLAPPPPRPGDTASASPLPLPPPPLCRDTRLFPSVYFSHPLTSPSLPPNPPQPHIPQVRANTVRECHYHDRVAPLLQCRVP